MKKRHTTPVPGKQPAASAEELQEKIRQRAYEIYELRGREDGDLLAPEVVDPLTAAVSEKAGWSHGTPEPRHDWADNACHL